MESLTAARVISANSGMVVPNVCQNKDLIARCSAWYGVYWPGGYSSGARAGLNMGVHETERNINNKISRGGFSATFLIQCLVAIGTERVDLTHLFSNRTAHGN